MSAIKDERGGETLISEVKQFIDKLCVKKKSRISRKGIERIAV